MEGQGLEGSREWQGPCPEEQDKPPREGVSGTGYAEQRTQYSLVVKQTSLESV